MLQLPVYLDHCATTACDPQVLQTMLPYFSQHFGNAASRHHAFGWQAAEAVTLAREQVAALINAEPNEVIFTSGSTEAINLALKGVFENFALKGNHIITCAIEHKAVLDTCRHLQKLGADVTYLPVQTNGEIDLQLLQAAIRPQTILIALQYANNEVGTIMPVKAIGEIARQNGIIFFTDATQAAGKINVDVVDDSIDLLAFSAHKMYGPKGVGALYVRRKNPRVKLSAQIEGGGHERGLRSGTLNVPGIVGFGKACLLAQKLWQQDAAHTARLRDKVENALLTMKETFVNGNTLQRLPHVTNITFRYAESENILMAIQKNIAASAGSACTSGTLEPSYVLKAMGLQNDLAFGAIRFSLGRYTTEAEIDFAIEQMNEVVTAIRAARPRFVNS